MRESLAAESARMAGVASVEPSSTTISSKSAWLWLRMLLMVRDRWAAPLKTGRTTEMEGIKAAARSARP
jgi:hypothetical protein